MSEDKAQDEQELLSDSGSDESGEEEGSEEEVGSWITWFCSLKGNEFFCEVGEDYIQDDFNLSGLSSQVPYYDYALDLILDSESLQNEVLTEAAQEMVEEAAEILYGLIHARYILTSRGLAAMMEKFKNCDFGRCPRVFCNGQACLPVGLSDIPRQSTVKLFCPRCEDAYYPRSKYHGNLDGAYFGTTFAHLFQLTYPQLRPIKPTDSYVPKVFGFKIHPSAWEQQAAKRSGAAPQQQQAQQQQQERARQAVGNGGPAAVEQQQAQQQQQQPEQQPDGAPAPAKS
ncbi:Casein kinase II subunit beta [Micractinium conductrix]|uniref:Casein kinase II subunit beta n=1 Tax=Micractinium conductrix TaxID=554055 RepID=A0A2P6VRQ7_9CHLO|nr:Casein kinase II subunit beta [Micractinium conductrix]|eukprot:PSC76755.1 Casein kinase II subunit beta [Micractinium conductrix]